MRFTPVGSGHTSWLLVVTGHSEDDSMEASDLSDLVTSAPHWLILTVLDSHRISGD